MTHRKRPGRTPHQQLAPIFPGLLLFKNEVFAKIWGKPEKIFPSSLGENPLFLSAIYFNVQDKRTLEKNTVG